MPTTKISMYNSDLTLLQPPVLVMPMSIGLGTHSFGRKSPVLSCSGAHLVCTDRELFLALLAVLVAGQVPYHRTNAQQWLAFLMAPTIPWLSVAFSNDSRPAIEARAIWDLCHHNRRTRSKQPEVLLLDGLILTIRNWINAISMRNIQVHLVAMGQQVLVAEAAPCITG